MRDIVKAGFDAGALMGSSLSSRQRALLLSHFSEALMLLDGDDTGQQATRHIAEALNNVVKLRVGVVPDGRQPDKLGADELRRLVTEAFL